MPDLERVEAQQQPRKVLAAATLTLGISGSVRCGTWRELERSAHSPYPRCLFFVSEGQYPKSRSKSLHLECCEGSLKNTSLSTDKDTSLEPSADCTCSSVHSSSSSSCPAAAPPPPPPPRAPPSPPAPMRASCKPRKTPQEPQEMARTYELV